MDEYLTPLEAAALLRLSVHTLAKWRSLSTDGPAWVEVGGVIRYRREDLSAWLDARRRDGAGGSA